MVQNFSLIEYGNCRDPCASADAMFYSCTSQFREKNPVLPIEKYPFLELARNTVLQHLIIHFSLHQLSKVIAYGRVNTMKNFKLLALKVVAVAYERWSLTRGSKCSDLTWKLLVFSKTGR